MSWKLSRCIAVLLFTGSIETHLVSRAAGQTAEDWTRFGLGIADAVINGGNPRGQTEGRQYIPNQSSGHVQGGMNTSRNPLFHQSNQNGRWYPSSSQPAASHYYNPYRAPHVTYHPQPHYEHATRPAAPATVYSGQPITIRCPDSESGICSYSLLSASGAYNYTIQPGQTQNLRETQVWRIRYDQGNGSGTKTYRLRGGRAYLLERTDDGYWQLYQES